MFKLKYEEHKKIKKYKIKLKISNLDSIKNKINRSKYINFHDLTPMDNADITGYEEALDYAFNNDKIKNIAITGSYGSGKSSVLYTYEKKHPTLKFLYVSFLHFKDSKKNDNNVNSSSNVNNFNNDRNVKEENLEIKVINHIINQIPVKDIPDTNFDVRGDISFPRALRKAIGSFLVVVSFLFLLKINFFIKLINENKIEKFFKNMGNSEKIFLIFLITLLIVTLIIVIIYLFYFYKKRNNKILGKIKISDLELNMDKSKNNGKYDSFFDKYLSEILYILENCKYDVIVFEDIDRFEIRIIFERLKEINTLLNKRFKGNRVIKFCYVIREDLFNSEDRVKIFDFIIPVVSIMNGFSSINKFKEYFKEYCDEENKTKVRRIDEKFIDNVSTYITNLRVLKNIYNEFIMYKCFLDKYNLVLNFSNKLAIIIYKNLFPGDFSNVNYNEGFLYDIFYNRQLKSNFISSNKSKLKELKGSYEIRMKKLERRYILHRLQIYLYSEILYTCSNKEMKYFIRMRYSKYLIDKEYYKTLKQEFENDQLYTINLVKGLIFDILKLEYNLDCIKSNNFFNMCEDDKLFDELFEECINKYNVNKKYYGLLNFLIKKGYIDEGFRYYTTYFEHEGFSQGDKNYIYNVINKYNKYNKKWLFWYKLENVPSVVHILDDKYYYYNNKILNFYVLDYLLQCASEFGINKEYLKYEKLELGFKLWAFLIQLNAKENFYFVIEYITRNIKNNAHYLNEEFVKSLQKANVQFENIEHEKLSNKVLRIIEKSDLYEINRENIKYLVKKLNSDITNEELIHKNYSLICRRKDSELYKRIHKDFDGGMYIYLSHYVYMISSEKINDDEQDVIKLINLLFGVYYDKCDYNNREREVHDGLKTHEDVECIISAYILYLETEIKLLNSLNILSKSRYNCKFIERSKIMYGIILICKVTYCVENIYEYYLRVGLDDILISFVNHEGDKPLILDYEKYNEDEKLDFYNNCSDYNIADVKNFLNDLKNDNRVNSSKKREIKVCIKKIKKLKRNRRKFKKI